jgi:hypothetical protein
MPGTRCGGWRPKYDLYVDEEHIARCIATYDEWLTKRATCPDCQNFSLQKGRDQYGCFGLRLDLAR